MTEDNAVNIEAMKQALEKPGCERVKDFYGVGPVQRAAIEQLLIEYAAIEAEQAKGQESVAFITPLMEQQMFDDWCPYKGNPDPRTVWAAAIDAANGLLLGASQPAQTAREWQPIETAPKDGTVVLGYRDGRTGTASRVPRDDCEMWTFCGTSGDVSMHPALKPTHWMPLPYTPTKNAGQPVKEN